MATITMAATASHDATVQPSGRSLAPAAPSPRASARRPTPATTDSTHHLVVEFRAVVVSASTPHATPNATLKTVTSNHRAEPRARSKPGSQLYATVNTGVRGPVPTPRR